MNQKQTFEETNQLMKEQGWTRKDFKNSDHYRGWYYRNHKKVVINHSFHLDHPMTFYYKPIEEFCEDTDKEAS